MKQFAVMSLVLFFVLSGCESSKEACQKKGAVGFGMKRMKSVKSRI